MGELVLTVPADDAGNTAVADIRENGERELGCRYAESLADKLGDTEARGMVERFQARFHLLLTRDGEEALVANRIIGAYTGEGRRPGRIIAVEPNLRFTTSGQLGLPFTLGGKHTKYLDQMKLNQKPSATTGSGVRVAVIDTGLDPGSCKVTFAGAFDVTASPVQQSAPTDTDGHGTAMATLIREVAADADIYIVRAFDDSGVLPLWHLMAALPVAAYDCTAAIISMSLGITNMPLRCGTCGAMLSVRLLAYDKMLDGIRNHPNYGGEPPVYLAATGNAFSTTGFEFPASQKETLAVGSVTSTPARSGFSNYGTTNHPWHLMAPGGEDTAAAGVTEDVGYGSKEKCRGTSVSTAYAAGMLALLRSETRYASKTRDDFIADVLRDHCEPLSGVPTLEQGAGQIVYVKQAAGQGQGDADQVETQAQSRTHSGICVGEHEVIIGGVRLSRRDW